MMNLEFNNEQLQADMKVLQAQRVSTEKAEKIAKCKQAVEYAASLIEDFEFLDSVEIPDAVYQNLEAAKFLLEKARNEMQTIFNSGEETR